MTGAGGGVRPDGRDQRAQLVTNNMGDLDLHLLPVDADLVRCTPLPTMCMGDFWGWSCEKSGEFTVPKREERPC